MATLQLLQVTDALFVLVIAQHRLLVLFGVRRNRPRILKREASRSGIRTSWAPLSLAHQTERRRDLSHGSGVNGACLPDS